MIIITIKNIGMLFSKVVGICCYRSWLVWNSNPRLKTGVFTTSQTCLIVKPVCVLIQRPFANSKNFIRLHLDGAVTNNIKSYIICINTLEWGFDFFFQTDGKSTAFGEDFQEVARHCYDLNPNQLVAVGVNCTAPRLIESLISGINDRRKSNPIPLIVYPNSGESYNVEQG